MTVTSRGTSNTNARSGAPARRRSKHRLLERYAADVDLVTRAEFDDLFRAMYDDVPALWDDAVTLWTQTIGVPDGWVAVIKGLGRPAARCYRCGWLLVFCTMERDRIVAGIEGGQYVDNNIRPCCSPCNLITGNETKAKLRRRRLAKAAAARAARARAKARKHLTIVSPPDGTMSG